MFPLGTPTSSSASSPLPVPAASACTALMIIGGGVFGLAAAHKLRNAGFHPVIIEARERLGGRVWTDENGFHLGASWIHGQSGNPLMDLVNQTKARTLAFDDNNHWRYDANGELTDMFASCFAESASEYPTPEEWIKTAGPFLLKISPRDYGRPLTAPC
jgi:monoamine oxidase